MQDCGQQGSLTLLITNYILSCQIPRDQCKELETCADPLADCKTVTVCERFYTSVRKISCD